MLEIISPANDNEDSNVGYPGKQLYLTMFGYVLLATLYPVPWKAVIFADVWQCWYYLVMSVTFDYPGKQLYLPMFGNVDSQDPKVSMAAVMIVTKSGTP